MSCDIFIAESLIPSSIIILWNIMNYYSNIRDWGEKGNVQVINKSYAQHKSANKLCTKRSKFSFRIVVPMLKKFIATVVI
jgi:hypothetical protein